MPTAASFAASVPLAEDARVRVIGYLTEGDGRPWNLAAALKEFGYVEGGNLRFELVRLPGPSSTEETDRAAVALARSGAEVLVAQGAPHTSALHRATTRIPIVTYGVSNPVSLGLARSLRAPGMNVTGLSFGLEDAAVLQFGALRLLRPGLKRIVFMVPAVDSFAGAGGSGRLAPEHVAAAGGLDLDAAPMESMRDYEKAFAAIRHPKLEAAWVVETPVGPAKPVAALAMRYKLATHGQSARSVSDGLLVSCGLRHSQPHRRVAGIIDKILRGADPATIPFEQPDKSELVLNRRTAAAIGAAIPEELRLRASEIVG